MGRCNNSQQLQECISNIASCYSAGAKRWSREAQDWNKQVAVEGMSAAENIVSERRSLLKEAVLAGSRQGLVDGTADRQYRGQECGNGLGICLGVAAAGEALGPEGSRLSAAERTEVALDLRKLVSLSLSLVLENRSLTAFLNGAFRRVQMDCIHLRVLTYSKDSCWAWRMKE